MRGLVYMASRDKVDVDTFHKGIQYALERLGKAKFTKALGTSLLIIPELGVLVLTKRHVGSGNEIAQGMTLGALRSMPNRDICYLQCLVFYILTL